MTDQATPLTIHPAVAVVPPTGLVGRARRLAWIGIGWHVVEAAIALAAGIAAGSIALIGFGADSLIETAAGLIVVWRFAASRVDSPSAEKLAQRLIAASFAVLVAYISVEAVRGLAAAHHPDASWVGSASQR